MCQLPSRLLPGTLPVRPMHSFRRDAGVVASLKLISLLASAYQPPNGGARACKSRVENGGARHWRPSTASMGHNVPESTVNKPRVHEWSCGKGRKTCSRLLFNGVISGPWAICHQPSVPNKAVMRRCELIDLEWCRLESADFTKLRLKKDAIYTYMRQPGPGSTRLLRRRARGY